MYLPTSEACNAANGTQVPTTELNSAAAGLAAMAGSIQKAQAAFASTLTRAPSDFECMGSGVASDVAAVNQQTGPTRGSLARGKPGDNPPSCDVSNTGGCDVVPLNGPGSGAPPSANARPAPLRTKQGVSLPPIPCDGLGRVGGSRRRAFTVANRLASARRRGMGATADPCNDFAPWGDAFPSGGPLLSPADSILNWMQQNPLVVLAGAALGIWIAADSQKGKR